MRAVDLGRWSVTVTEDGREMKHEHLDYQGMLALLIAPVGVAVNREQRVTWVASLDGTERIRLETLVKE